MSRLAAVVFDLDDTLMPENAAVDDAFRATCAIAFPNSTDTAELLARRIRARARALWRAAPTHPHCARVGISSWEGLWGAFADTGPHRAFLRAWLPEYRTLAWLEALRDVGVSDPALAARLRDAFRDHVRARLSPYPGAIDAVRALRVRSRVGLLTNGDSGVQREKIDDAGLAAEFDAVLVSGDISTGKPDAAPFRHILDRLGARTTDSVMVGNSLTSDVLGGQRVGMRAVWLSDGRQPAVTARPDAVISHLAELSAALAHLCGAERWSPAPSARDLGA